MDKAKPKDFITLRLVDQISAFKIGYYSSFPFVALMSFTYFFMSVMNAMAAESSPDLPHPILAAFLSLISAFTWPAVIGGVQAFGISIKNSVTPWRSEKVILKIDGPSRQGEKEA
jgi:hypothetical protein